MCVTIINCTIQVVNINTGYCVIDDQSCVKNSSCIDTINLGPVSQRASFYDVLTMCLIKFNNIHTCVSQNVRKMVLDYKGHVNLRTFLNRSQVL